MSASAPATDIDHIAQHLSVLDPNFAVLFRADPLPGLCRWYVSTRLSILEDDGMSSSALANADAPGQAVRNLFALLQDVERPAVIVTPEFMGKRRMRWNGVAFCEVTGS